MPYIENFEEFCERQGCEKVWFPEVGRFLFKNGASTDGHQVFTDPHPVPRYRLEVQIRFAKRRVSDAEREFALCKSAGMGLQESNGINVGYMWNTKVLGPEPDGPEFYDPEYGHKLASKALLEIKKIVFGLRDELKRLEEEYNSLPEIKRKLDADRSHRAARHAMEIFRDTERAACQKINI